MVFGNQQIYFMDNPESSSALSPEVIYSYDTHRNIPWNETEYQPVRKYFDARQQVTDRSFQNVQKGGKDPNYLTRRGFYMDYHLKVVKALPSPSDHPMEDPWDQSHNLKRGKFNKLDLSLSKYTYLDRINMQQKNRTTPAPGSYNLERTEEQIKKEQDALKSKKHFQGDKHFFFQDTEHLSNIHAGMGAYNPHLEVPHIKVDKTNHKFWIDKHKKEGEKMAKRRSVEPAPGTHTPIPAGYTTFERIMTAGQVKRKKKDMTSTGFGTDSKFEYTRPSKKKIIQERPSPSAHNLVLEWKGKNMQIKTNNWIRSRSFGPQKGVYH